ncbi:RNA polymerase sigma factor [Butyricicoccus sp.]|uniref:RNA polymerase sigma factor n=1 Tax=Butyricicoccus sp. TaxID=2049021 RepID=UPI003F162548
MNIGQIYEDYFLDVYKYVRGLSASDTVAEEITQETFFRAMRSLDSFRGDCDVRVWLCRIARNCYFTYLKKQKHVTGNEADFDLTPDVTDIEQQLVDKDRAFAVHQALHALPEPYREVFTLRVFGELSFAQIGALFGKTDHWACVTYHRARQKIQKQTGGIS